MVIKCMNFMSSSTSNASIFRNLWRLLRTDTAETPSGGGSLNFHISRRWNHNSARPPYTFRGRGVRVKVNFLTIQKRKCLIFQLFRWVIWVRCFMKMWIFVGLINSISEISIFSGRVKVKSPSWWSNSISKVWTMGKEN